MCKEFQVPIGLYFFHVSTSSNLVKMTKIGFPEDVRYNVKDKSLHFLLFKKKKKDG